MHTITTGYTDRPQTHTVLDAAAELTEVTVNTYRHADGYTVSFDSVYVASDELAAELAGSFAKNRKVTAGHTNADRSPWALYGDKTGRDYSLVERFLVPTVNLGSFRLMGNGVTGAKNETAAKRLRALLADLAGRGVTVVEPTTNRATNAAPLADALAAN